MIETNFDNCDGDTQTRQKPHAYEPFCSHLYSDSIQGSARASQTTGRTGKVDNLGQDLLLESSTDHRP